MVSTQAADIAWMLTATALVLLMTPGLSFFYGGMVGSKNIVATMLQSFICLGLVSLIWILVGFSLAFGDSLGGLLGNPSTFFLFRHVDIEINSFLSPSIPLLLFAMFQMKFAVITPALITGSFAERVQFSSYLIFISLFTLFIYCPLAHWTWHPHGILHQLGVLDFAGGTVVHLSAGIAALTGAWFLGPRMKPKHQPASVPFVILGTGMLWFGWFGFNSGSALGANQLAVLAFSTTHAASASAMMTWIGYDLWRKKPLSALNACIGAIVGLVAITPAAGYVTVQQALTIGVLASLASILAISLRSKTSLDDTLDVFPCHGVGGIVGMLATGYFTSLETLQVHILALCFVFVFVFFTSLLLYKITDWILPMRVSQKQEQAGLDHGAD